MTSFYVCPADPLVRRLIQPGVIAKKRSPIAERAKLLWEKSLSFLPQAALSLDIVKFELGSNRFTLHLIDILPSQKLMVATLSQLASIFSGKYIGVWVKYFNARKERSVMVVTWVMSQPYEFPENRFKAKIDEKSGRSLNLHFEVLEKEIYCVRLGSEEQGAGGAALAAIYNLAVILEKENIRYYVYPENNEAKRFFLHMDYGKPEGADLCHWRVPVPRKVKFL